MAIKLNTASGSITLEAEDGSGNVNVTVPRDGFLSTFVLEDDDGTEVSISNAEEVKFIGSGITTNWTDTSTGSDGDPFDMTFSIDAAQTGITSIYATDLILGEDAQTAIDFGTTNEIDFKIDNAARLTVTSGTLEPVSDDQIDLGTSSLKFKDAYFDGTVNSDAFAGPLTGDVTGNVSGTAGSATGNAATATALATARTIGGTSFDGTANIAVGLAATATALATARTIGGTSFDGTANIAVGLAGTATALATARTIHGVSFDGTANIDLSEEVADTVGAMVSGNTESGITVTYQDGDNTLDFTIGTLNQDTTGTAATVTGAAQSAITSVGTLTALTVDNVVIDGAVIGHTGDTDLMTLASGIVTVAGEVSMTTLDIGGTNVTSTAAELNLLDGVSGLVQADLTKLAAVDATAVELNIMDGGTSAGTTAVAAGDGIVTNDGGTMQQTTAATFDTYFAATTKTLTNKTLTSPTLTTPVLGTPSSGNLSSCTADGTNGVGYKNIPQNSQSAAYTLVLADSGKHIHHPSSDATARTYTIPANSSVAYPIGTAVTFTNLTAQVVTIAITSDTMYLAKEGTTGNRSLARYGMATALKTDSTKWIISGNGLT